MPAKINPFTGKLDLVEDLSGYVPYTGATGNVDLGANNLTVGGTLTVDGGIKSNGNITLKAGQRLIFDGA